MILRRFLATLLITTLTMGCASKPTSARPDRRARVSQITSMTAVPVLLTVSSFSFSRRVEVRHDWSDTARANVMHAIAKHFGQDARFRFNEWYPGDTEAIQPDLERARLQIEEIRVTTPDDAVECLPHPAITLADAAATDAVLLVYAQDTITTRRSLAIFIPLMIIAFPILLLLSPFVERAGSASRAAAPRVGLDTIALCLVDPRKGETIWFHTESVDFGSLRDSSLVDRLIRRAYAHFSKGPETEAFGPEAEHP